MPIFPNTEKEAAELCDRVLAGLAKNPGPFPTAAKLGETLKTAFEAYRSAKGDQRRYREKYANATERKNETLNEVVALLRETVKAAEADAEKTPGELKSIGWGPPKLPGRPRKTTGEAPGPPLKLAASEPEPGIARLEWRPPAEGGKPGYYEIMRREPGADGWAIAGVVPSKPGRKIKAMLDGQPSAKGLAYQVVAANRWGRSKPSAEALVSREGDEGWNPNPSEESVDKDDTTAPSEWRKNLEGPGD